MMRTDLKPNFAIETIHIPKTSNTHLSKIHSYRGVPVRPDNEEIIRFCVELIRANAKSWIIIYRKNVIRLENPSIHVVFRGVSPKISFLLWFIYNCLFTWPPATKVMKFGALGKKSMPNPNMSVYLLSGQFLTMNLQYNQITSFPKGLWSYVLNVDMFVTC